MIRFFLIVILCANCNEAQKTFEKKSTIEMLQGTWILNADSLSSATIKGNAWNYGYIGYPDRSFDMELTNRIPQFVDTTVVAKFIALSDKTDTFYYEIEGLSEQVMSLMDFPRGKLYIYYKKR